MVHRYQTFSAVMATDDVLRKPSTIFRTTKTMSKATKTSSRENVENENSSIMKCDLLKVNDHHETRTITTSVLNTFANTAKETEGTFRKLPLITRKCFYIFHQIKLYISPAFYKTVF
jgi:hypothetical protein